MYKNLLSSKLNENPFLPLSNAIYEILLDEIIKFNLTPHDNLKEYKLAELFDVSRTPVNQALKKLEKKGFVYIKPSVGYFVSPYDPDEFFDIHSTRVALETLAVEQACERITDEELSNLFHLCKELDIAYISLNTYNRLNAENNFHCSLVQCSHNKHLIHAYNSILLQIERYRYYATSDWLNHEKNKGPAIANIVSVSNNTTDAEIKTYQFKTNIAYEHYLIYRAILTRDKKAANAAVRFQAFTNVATPRPDLVTKNK